MDTREISGLPAGELGEKFPPNFLRLHVLADGFPAPSLGNIEFGNLFGDPAIRVADGIGVFAEKLQVFFPPVFVHGLGLPFSGLLFICRGGVPFPGAGGCLVDQLVNAHPVYGERCILKEQHLFQW